MLNTLIQILLGILKKLITEKFFSRVWMIGLKALSKSTKNKVDDEICKSVGEALGIPCE